MKPLGDLLEGVEVLSAHGDLGTPIAAVAFDSRGASPGACFVGLSGTRVDGAAFAGEAVARGAVAVIAGRPADPALLGKAVWVHVGDAHRAGASIAAAWHDRPFDRLVALGVTGTNGKTTTTYLLERALADAGRVPGLIGTIDIRIAGRTEPASLTTPDIPALHGIAARMADAGVTHVAMEVSSHALALRRIEGIRFHAAAFTNLSQDHLDFHGTFEEYADAKLRLFRDHLRPDATAVVTADDPVGDRVAAAASAAGARIVRFSLRPDAAADLVVREANHRVDGTRAILGLFGESVVVETALTGPHNVANLLAAVGLAAATGVPPAAAARSAARVAIIPGRLERIVLPNGASAFVDYSHTPDALEHALAALRPLCAARLWVVLGCGGDRDRAKRPLMGEVAARADKIVITSDNPRTESPDVILDQIEAGLVAAGVPRGALTSLGNSGRAYAREPDRAAAIAAVVALAAPQDIILVAGKGHETYQIIGTTKRHFDDREEVRRAAGIRS